VQGFRPPGARGRSQSPDHLHSATTVSGRLAAAAIGGQGYQLVDLIPNADDVLALEPDELGHCILKVLNSWHAHQALQLSTFINTTLGHPQTPNAGLYPTNRRGELQEALSTA
jgi:hypothetical protein